VFFILLTVFIFLRHYNRRYLRIISSEIVKSKMQRIVNSFVSVIVTVKVVFGFIKLQY